MRTWTRRILDPGPEGVGAGVGMLLLRISGAVMALTHGWSKLASFGEKSAGFPDPLGVSPQVSMALTIFAEFFCALAVLAGAGTRLAAGFVAFTMGVAGFVVLAGSPFGDRELAFAYLLVFLALIFTGAGRFSLDRFFSRTR